MSAKSCWVTCGIVVQDRVSAGPEILLMRLSFSSTVSPNAENSFSPATAGWGVGAAGAGSAGAVGAAAAPLVVVFAAALSTSLTVIRPLGPSR